MTDSAIAAHEPSTLPEALMTKNATRRRTAYVETYGCQMNISDGELMQGVLAAQGYDIVATPEAADVVLVNTCAIREHAEQRVIGRVGELSRLKQENPDLVIGVTGCMAQRLGNRLLDKAKYVDLVMGPDGYRSLPQVLGELRPALATGSTQGAAGEGIRGGAREDAASADAGGASVDSAAASHGTMRAQADARPRRRALPVLDTAAADDVRDDGRIAVLSFDSEENYEDIPIQRAPGVTAWVSVQRGCDHRCTYCIVPYVRGPEKNRQPEMVLREVRSIAEQGITEVTLLGQTVNSYRHGDWDFPRLLRAVARVDGIRRVRFTSPHPGDVTPALIEVMATEPHVCRQLHLPAQSGSDRTLRRMLRRYTVAELVEKVGLVRTAMPDIALSTDIIVGFPGETDEEYEETLALMQTIRFDDAYLYKYSAREGTPATRLPAAQFVPEDVAQERLARIIALHRSIQAEINARAVGDEMEVLVERSARSAGDMLGRTDGNKVVAFPGGMDLIGQYLQVRLTSTTGATFRGIRLEKRAQAAVA